MLPLLVENPVRKKERESEQNQTANSHCIAVMTQRLYLRGETCVPGPSPSADLCTCSRARPGAGLCPPNRGSLHGLQVPLVAQGLGPQGFFCNW